METSMILVFVIGYLAVALEHVLKINKAAVATLMAALLWIIHTMIMPDLANIHLSHQLSEVTSIVLFLLGAMIIVELVDCHGGFSLVAHLIKAKSRLMLILIVSFLTFFLSAILDNLTTTIIMIAIMFKLIQHPVYRLWFASIIVISANSGGAWSPIGDVTTIMLWVKGNVTTDALIPHLILPSLVSMIVPLFLILPKIKGDAIVVPGPTHFEIGEKEHPQISRAGKASIVIVGVGGLMSVPVFKSVTGLPPYMGILLVLGLLWVLTEVIYGHVNIKESQKLRISKVLKAVDLPTAIFFFGILMAVGALQEQGLLSELSNFLDSNFDNVYLITGIIGVLSAIIDNVPLVAAAMGMYPLADPATVEAGSYAAAFVQNGTFWEMLTYCAGVGGSMLIIGSAAGVAAMGVGNVSFGWYLKNISWRAFIGYIAGIFTYILIM